ncbi:MAG: hypothetical protein RR959_09010 [Erysipelotrichaceae bacterium]
MKIEEVDLELRYYSMQFRSGLFWITKEEQDNLLDKVKKVDKSKLNQENLELITRLFKWELDL